MSLPAAPAPSRPGAVDSWRRPVGLVLVVPALVALVGSYLLPTLWVVRASFRSLEVLRGVDAPGPAAPGQPDSGNYAEAADAMSIPFTLSLTVVPLLAALVVAPLVAWCANRAGQPARWATRALLAVPLAVYAPAMTAREYWIAAGLDEVPTGLVRNGFWAMSVGLVVALSATAYLAALRSGDRRSLYLAGAVAAAGALAGALQAFAHPLLAIGDTRASTPLVAMLELALVRVRFGPAASAVTPLLAVLVVLGMAVTLLVVLSRARLSVEPVHVTPVDVTPADVTPVDATPVDATPVDRAAPRGSAAAAGLGLLLLGLLIVFWYGVGPYLSGLFGRPEQIAFDGAVMANTWLPPLVTSVVGVGLAALAAFGIGALRPFGERSEWLLLPFGCFLFVGAWPAALRAVAGGRTASWQSSWLGLLPPVWLTVPALVLLTVLFRGQAGVVAARGGALVRGVLLPVLPMVGIVFFATWLVQAYDLLWPLLSAGEQYPTWPILQFDGAGGVAGWAPLAVTLVALAIAVAAQLTYLDRLVLRVGADDTMHE